MLKSAIKTLIIMLALVHSPLARAHEELSPQNKADIKKMISEYLQNNPKELAQALDNMQDYYRAESERQKKLAVKNLGPQITNDPRDKYIGKRDAKHVIVEFFDYNCTYCRKNLTAVQKLIEERDDILFIFKELPILSETSGEAARAALAIESPQNYFEFHKRLMQAKERLTSNDIFNALQRAGENPAAILTFSKSTEITSHIADNQKLAQELGISGTPSFYINGKIYEGYLDKDEISALLKN